MPGVGVGWVPGAPVCAIAEVRLPKVNKVAVSSNSRNFIPDSVFRPSGPLIDYTSGDSRRGANFPMKFDAGWGQKVIRRQADSAVYFAEAVTTPTSESAQP